MRVNETTGKIYVITNDLVPTNAALPGASIAVVELRADATAPSVPTLAHTGAGMLELGWLGGGLLVSGTGVWLLVRR